MKTLLLVLLMINVKAFGDIPETIRKEYASRLYDAFRLQCEGKSTQAFFAFQEGFQKGIKSGESPVKLQIVADMFYWYRRYGNHLKLFSKTPTDNDIISDEYDGHRCPFHKSYHASRFKEKERYSEFGNDPRQERLLQDFMWGIGEMISGILLAVVCPESLLFLGGGALVGRGFWRIKDSLHDLWTDHQIELYELKKLSERANQVSP
ncbi:MAG: hypothetical protein KGJ02_06815 [Verrucomicrobiota bacterium]|nr:hypothetical protein [Verrucomicrobiota bacterium]